MATLLFDSGLTDRNLLIDTQYAQLEVQDFNTILFARFHPETIKTRDRLSCDVSVETIFGFEVLPASKFKEGATFRLLSTRKKRNALLKFLSPRKRLSSLGAGKIAKTWYETIKRDSLKKNPTHEEHAILLKYRRAFSIKEFERIKLGLRASCMDDKWIILFEDGYLYVYRSWTGACAFKLKIIPVTAGFVCNEAWAYETCAEQDNRLRSVAVLESLMNGLSREAEIMFS